MLLFIPQPSVSPPQAAFLDFHTLFFFPTLFICSSNPGLSDPRILVINLMQMLSSRSHQVIKDLFSKPQFPHGQNGHSDQGENDTRLSSQHKVEPGLEPPGWDPGLTLPSMAEFPVFISKTDESKPKKKNKNTKTTANKKHPVYSGQRNVLVS